MKLTIHSKHFCALAVTGIIFGQAQAATLISDSFTGIADGTALTGRTPAEAANPLWVWSAPTGTFLSNGAGGILANVGSNRTAGITLGSGYFANNPGIYTLSSTIHLGSGASANSWFGIGFSTADATTTPFSSQNLTDNGAFGWMILRTGGNAVVFPNAGTSGGITTLPGTSNVDIAAQTTLRLTLNTSGTSWFLNAFIGDFEVDLNGAANGTAYTWTGSGIPDLKSVAISTGFSGDAGIAPSIADNFQLTFTPVPEPTSVALLGLASVLPLLRRKR